MTDAGVDAARRRRRRLRGAAGRVAVIVLSGALALTACGGDKNDAKSDAKNGAKSGSTKNKEPVERHTVVLEATSDYGRPMVINYFGTATGPQGMVMIGEEGKGELSAESPWKVTLTVDGKDPWVHLSANGAGCIGRAIGGDSCDTGSIPNREDITGTGTTTCRITIDGKVVEEKSYTWPTIIPVTCLTPRSGQSQ
ncbi:hypothetical protein AB0I68_11835 [Streptomyces sp. NPDC050448]|uniref:hypothetical protein n=1 Tax=Streptomyces sp. NPDC050448 TaxID=3155404 RepID=UPI00342A9F2E